MNAALRACDCGSMPGVYTHPAEPGGSIRCMECWAETTWQRNIADAIALWEAGEWNYQEPIGGGVFISDLGERP